MAADSIELRPRNLAPHEEFQQRLTYVVAPQKLADSDIAMLLNHTRYATVKACAICFEENGVTHRFRHINALSCQPSMNSKKVLVHWVRDFPDAVFVMTSDLKFVETVPRVGRVKWFDSEATSRELHEQQTRLNRLSDELTELHKGETEEQLAATTRNIERVQASNAMQTTHSFPVSAERGGPTTPDETPEIDEVSVGDDASPSSKYPRDESQPEGGSGSRILSDTTRSCLGRPVSPSALAERQRHRSRPGDAISEEIDRQRAREHRAADTQRAAGRILKAVSTTASGDDEKPEGGSARGIIVILMKRSRTLNASAGTTADKQQEG